VEFFLLSNNKVLWTGFHYGRFFARWNTSCAQKLPFFALWGQEDGFFIGGAGSGKGAFESGVFQDCLNGSSARICEEFMSASQAFERRFRTDFL